MKFRIGLVIVGVAAILAVAVSTYWYSHRQIVVEGPMLGGPPPSPRRHENLVGRPAPRFSAVDQNGRIVETTAPRDHVVVVSVWATWCPPCRDELPRIEREVWRRFGPQVVVIAVAGGESMNKIKAFNKNAGLTFSLVEDPEKRIARLFGGHDVIPRIYVIDHAGLIVHQTVGYGEKSFGEFVAAVENAVNDRRETRSKPAA